VAVVQYTFTHKQYIEHSSQNRSMQQDWQLNVQTARSRNHSCYGKEINITYFEYVFVAWGIEHANACAVFYCHLGLSGSILFFYIIS